MKAVVILSICLSVVSCHVLTKRSLLEGGPHGHGHDHHHHQAHAHGQGHGEQQSNGQKLGGRRGREEADQAPEGYLPPYDDYQEDSLGGNQEQGQNGDSETEYDYEYDDQQGQYGEQGQYDDEGSEEGAQGQYGNSQDYPDYYDEEPLPTGNNEREDQSDYEDKAEEENTAADSYGAPAPAADVANEDSVEINDKYNSPSSDEADDDYSSTIGSQSLNPPRRKNQGARRNEINSAKEAEDENSSPNSRQSALSTKRNNNKPGSSSRRNGFPFQSIAGRPTGGRKAERDHKEDNNEEEGIKERECPGGSIEECVQVCPGTTLRVYGACVNGCAERCSSS